MSQRSFADWRDDLTNSYQIGCGNEGISRFLTAASLNTSALQLFKNFAVARLARAAGSGFFQQANSLLQFSFFVNEQTQARKYLVSGVVQGVGFRYFTQRAAARLKVGGYVRNLKDGRVEVFAMGTAKQLDELCSHLERGPRFSSVTQVLEESAASDAQYEHNFVIGPND